MVSPMLDMAHSNGETYVDPIAEHQPQQLGVDRQCALPPATNARSASA